MAREDEAPPPQVVKIMISGLFVIDGQEETASIEYPAAQLVPETPIDAQEAAAKVIALKPVSYTHLTLPTKA